MREFEDAEGRRWDVVVGRESWGAFFAIFVPREEGPVIRQTLLLGQSNEDAVRELEALDRDGLICLLDQSERKELGEP